MRALPCRQRSHGGRPGRLVLRLNRQRDGRVRNVDGKQARRDRESGGFTVSVDEQPRRRQIFQRPSTIRWRVVRGACERLCAIDLAARDDAEPPGEECELSKQL